MGSSSSIGTGRRSVVPRAARSRSSTAATSTRRGWRTWSTSCVLPEFDFFAWDARGHGRSPGARGDSPSFGTSVRDVQTFVDHIGAQHGFVPEDIGIVAQSVGAVVVATWVHDYAPAIRGMVLASPAFRVKLYVPFALPGLRLMRKLFGNFFVSSYVKAKFLTHDPARIASYDADPLLSRSISVNVLLGLQEAADRVVADAQAITVPTQLLVSGADWVVRHGPQHAFFDRLGSTVKERHVLHGFLHDTLGERDRARAVDRVRAFLVRVFAAPRARPNLIERRPIRADARGGGRARRAIASLSPRGHVLGRRRARACASVALLADGVRLGLATGFDSGSTLDYIYRNQANGRTPLGRWIDRTYLDAIGWRGIRQRKLDVEALLREAIARLRAIGSAGAHRRHRRRARPLRARRRRRHAGAARLHPAARLQRTQCRAGTALIGEKGLARHRAFVHGDAFDRASLATLAPRPTLGIVSGLYELMPDNAPVRQSLGGLADAIAPGGFLVYTGQPWHPQLELIARALTSHRQGAAWVMRRRTQEEMDQLVAAAGFRKLTQRIGESGIFSVSLAQRVA